MKKFTKFLRENKGVTAIEYGLIAGLIAVVIVAATGRVGAALNTTFGTIASAVAGASGS
ncbi:MULTISPECIES: Flp family type IVb pilin [Paraburkholderia]|uniref:Flp family type IVb pilin n=1 Tax=Paraburkholderia TaxID=1822464 RepID=UPI00225604FA|nr:MULTISPECIES: Flp family type IVb pilin [Paraburkholderia]MCX4164436.1 Flp family type IVb pilin [Paraburkholderia megapolitana]MDN7159929.1 Flp family type IVb pilin [Paraburkholderia sp. CHISQ3]MDQ6496976.1 Flp family type IVb pilin [Paraburkholderia megapolitana]